MRDFIFLFLLYSFLYSFYIPFLERFTGSDMQCVLHPSYRDLCSRRPHCERWVARVPSGTLPGHPRRVARVCLVKAGALGPPVCSGSWDAGGWGNNCCRIKTPLFLLLTIVKNPIMWTHAAAEERGMQSVVGWPRV